MRVQVDVRADGSLLSSDIWLLTGGMAQTSQSREGLPKKERKTDDREGTGHVSDKALRQDKQQLVNYINL